MLSIYDMCQYSFGKYHLAIITNLSPYSDSARDSLAKEVMKHNPDYIYWLDGDQVYPGNAPEILMGHIDSGKMIVGGIVPLKKASDPSLDGKPSVWDMAPDSCATKNKEISVDRGVIRVDAMGLGGIMMNPEVFRKMKYPWFRMVWEDRNSERPGMDFQFYGRCREAGIDIWCDTGLIYGHMAVRQMPLRASVNRIII